MAITKTKEQWRKELSPEAFAVCREHGTEAPFSGKYYACKEDGIYHCICCDAPLFDANSKFDSGTGWPSFYDAIEKNITQYTDTSYGMTRIEVRCAQCDAHLGHLFEDGPQPTHLRYCINSVCLKLKEK